MKEFDLQAAKNGAKVQTRSGKPVRIISYDRKDKTYPIVALVEITEERENNISYTIDGRRCSISNGEYDLVMAPVKITRWVNVYHGGSDYKFGSICQTKESALNAIDKAAGYISTAKIEWEE